MWYDLLKALTPRLQQVASTAVVALALSLPFVGAAKADDARQTRLVVTLDTDPDTLVFNWDGPVFAPMAIEQVRPP